MTSGATPNTISVKQRILSSAVFKRGEKFTAGRMASQVGGDFRRVQNILNEMVNNGEIRRHDDSRGEAVYSKQASTGDLLRRRWVKNPSPSALIPGYAR